jgi:hypothetical protein
MSTADLLDHLLDPFAECLTPQAARKIADFRADDQTQRRIEHLANKCNEGSLTTAERREYDRFITTIDFITLLQAKARHLLDANGTG